jgi:hypothetical protein
VPEVCVQARISGLGGLVAEGFLKELVVCEVMTAELVLRCKRSGPAVPGSDERPDAVMRAYARLPAKPGLARPVHSGDRLLPVRFTLRSYTKNPMGERSPKVKTIGLVDAAASRRPARPDRGRFDKPATTRVLTCERARSQHGDKSDT